MGTQPHPREKGVSAPTGREDEAEPHQRGQDDHVSHGAGVTVGSDKWDALAASGGGQRDLDAGIADDEADERDLAAEERDRDASTVDAGSRERERVITAQAMTIARWLAQAGYRDAGLWADALEAVDQATAAAHATDTQAAWSAVTVAKDQLEIHTQVLFQAGLDRDQISRELKAVAQQLHALSQERRSHARDRSAARADRYAAHLDRDSARSDRQQSAVERARD